MACTSKKVNGVYLQLYGFRGNRWVRATGDGWLGGSYFYSRVPDTFRLNDVKVVAHIWTDPNYCDRIKGYNLVLYDGTEIHTKHPPSYDKPLPFSDPDLYELVDKILELDEQLHPKETHDSDSDNECPATPSVSDVLEIVEKISTTALDQRRLTDLLKGKDIYALVKDLDTANLKIKTLKEARERQEFVEKRLRNELSTEMETNNKLKQQMQAVQAENIQLKAERDGYKTDIINKVQETLSKM